MRPKLISNADRLGRREFLQWTALACGILGMAQGVVPSALGLNETRAPMFFPFCIDWHDSKKRGYAEQAVMLKELGYDGVGHIWLDGVADRLKTLDEAKLRLFQITMSVYGGQIN